MDISFASPRLGAMTTIAQFDITPQYAGSRGHRHRGPEPRLRLSGEAMRQDNSGSGVHELRPDGLLYCSTHGNHRMQSLDPNNSFARSRSFPCVWM